MKWVCCNKDDNNDDFIEMETANESGNGEMPSHSEKFVAFETRVSVIPDTKRMWLLWQAERYEIHKYLKKIVN